jgi:hypothetical protein
MNNLNIITDDLSLYKITDLYNSSNPGPKVHINYINEPGISVFEYVIKNRISNYDIVIGDLNLRTPPDSRNFIKLGNDLDTIIDSEKYFSFVKDHVIKYFGFSAPYAVDFPVIIARIDSIPKDMTVDEISMKGFLKLASSVSSSSKNSDLSQTVLGFSPPASSMSELDYFFIFNSSFGDRSNRQVFDSPESRDAYDFYNNYDIKYNFGIDRTKQYFSKFDNAPKRLYIKQKIISFDILPISKALTYPSDTYRLLFIKDMKYSGLNLKAVSLSRSSVDKKWTTMFLEYIFSDTAQANMLRETSEKIDLYDHINLPVIKGSLKNYSAIPINIANYEKYCNLLTNIDFHSIRSQKNFFDKYAQSKEMINEGIITESEFLKYLSGRL